MTVSSQCYYKHKGKVSGSGQLKLSWEGIHGYWRDLKPEQVEKLDECTGRHPKIFSKNFLKK